MSDKSIFRTAFDNVMRGRHLIVDNYLDGPSEIQSVISMAIGTIDEAMRQWAEIDEGLRLSDTRPMQHKQGAHAVYR